MDRKHNTLKQYFGYDQFRGGQEQLIDTVLNQQDVLGVMPTGAGKSLCFQLPALMLPGITLVISPLISLMKDQVGALCQSGIAAAYLNSSLTPNQYRKALSNAYRGQYKIIYIAPERLLQPDLLDFARNMEISLLAVDEAHCVSQWGHDFRPSYLDIPRFLEHLPKRPPVAAFTATATAQVMADICKLLALQNPLQKITGFDRPNLHFAVKPVGAGKERDQALMAELEDMAGKSGIIYCATRANVEKVCEMLQTQGIPATRYHAGLSDAERKRNQDAFAQDLAPIVAATNAFGMGIDKSNVSFVIHYNMPKDLESYYQEAGRAGRDGMPARCVMLFSPQDIILQKNLIQNGQDEEDRDPETIARNLERLQHMAGYCSHRACLRSYILKYFGETSPKDCGNCSSCQAERILCDLTEEARALFVFLRDSGGYMGPQTLCEVLLGRNTERVKAKRYHLYQAFGTFKGVEPRRIRAFIEILAEEGYLTQRTQPYYNLRLTEKAYDTLEGARCQLSLLPEELLKPSTRALTKQRERRAAATRPKFSSQSAAQTQQEDALFERLSALRLDLAKEQRVPAFVVFSNATLYDMAQRQPRTSAQFLQVTGVGQHKLLLYGDRFMREIREFLEGEE